MQRQIVLFTFHLKIPRIDEVYISIFQLYRYITCLTTIEICRFVTNIRQF